MIAFEKFRHHKCDSGRGGQAVSESIGYAPMAALRPLSTHWIRVSRPRKIPETGYTISCSNSIKQDQTDAAAKMTRRAMLPCAAVHVQEFKLNLKPMSFRKSKQLTIPSVFFDPEREPREAGSSRRGIHTRNGERITHGKERLASQRSQKLLQLLLFAGGQVRIL